MSHDHPYTWRELIDGVLVIGFLPRGAEDDGPDATYDRDIADFTSRLEEWDNLSRIPFLVVDFDNYEMTWDNGRAVVSLVLSAHRKLITQGGGVLVCNHPAQFNPDLQQIFRMDRTIHIFRTRQEALETARCRIGERPRSNK
jgi:hypothetical protein